MFFFKNGIFSKIVLIVQIFKKMYGIKKKNRIFFQKNVRIVRIFFFENCTDCTDFCTDFFKKVLATLQIIKIYDDCL